MDLGLDVAHALEVLVDERDDSSKDVAGPVEGQASCRGVEPDIENKTRNRVRYRFGRCCLKGHD